MTVDESPFCEKWKKETMKFSKRELVNWLANALNENKKTGFDETVLLLIKGETVSVADDEKRKYLKTVLREIKKNCTIVLSQLNE